MTRELYGSAVVAGLEGPLTELLNGASRLAVDLGGIDHSLDILGNRAPEGARGVRDRLENRLLAALTALARARAAGSESREDEERRLAEIAREIEREAELQAEAHRELRALLA